MKKRSFYNSINISLLIILIAYVLQVVVLLYQFNSGNPITQIINDSRNILFSFMIVMILYYISIMIYQPIKMKRSIKQLKHVFDEFRKGNYEYDLENLSEVTEKEYTPLVESIKKMIANIIQFDRLKEIKISAHSAKLKQLLALMSDGAMIIDDSGDILFINQVMTDRFINLDLDQNNNFLDTIYPDYFEKTIKKYVKEVLVKGARKEPCKMFIPEMDLEFTIKSSLYKNRIGDILGGVFIITDLQEKKEEKIEEEKREVKEEGKVEVKEIIPEEKVD